MARRPDGMTRRSDGWQGTEFPNLQTVQNLLEALLNSGIPFKQHHYNEVILSNRMWPITNQHKHFKRPQNVEDDQYCMVPPIWMQSMMEWMGQQMKFSQQLPIGRQAWVRKKGDVHPMRGNVRT